MLPSGVSHAEGGRGNGGGHSKPWLTLLQWRRAGPHGPIFVSIRYDDASRSILQRSTGAFNAHEASTAPSRWVEQQAAFRVQVESGKSIPASLTVDRAMAGRRPRRTGDRRRCRLADPRRHLDQRHGPPAARARSPARQSPSGRSPRGRDRSSISRVPMQRHRLDSCGARAWPASPRRASAEFVSMTTIRPASANRAPHDGR